MMEMVLPKVLEVVLEVVLEMIKVVILLLKKEDNRCKRNMYIDKI
jgi:hypothetical protein